MSVMVRNRFSIIHSEDLYGGSSSGTAQKKWS